MNFYDRKRRRNKKFNLLYKKVIIFVFLEEFYDINACIYKQTFTEKRINVEFTDNYFNSTIMTYWMLICLLLMLLNQTISQQETFSTISCSFDLQKDRNNPEEFNISSCKWNSCRRWSSNGEKRTCVEYEQYMIQNNWQLCMK